MRFQRTASTYRKWTLFDARFHLFKNFARIQAGAVQSKSVQVGDFGMHERVLSPEDSVYFGPFRFIRAQRSLTREGMPVAIGGRALDILAVLVDRAGGVVTGRELIHLVWQGITVEDANLRTQLTSLRKVLGDGIDGSRYILNIPSQGYSFVAPVSRETAVANVAEISVDAGPRRLPALPRVMVGRQDIVEKLSTMLVSRRLVTLVGTGGIGKTTVAIAIANSLSHSHMNGVYFVDLQLVTNPADVVSFVASAVGCVARGSSPEQSLVTYLSGRKACIVLDNCEHVIEAAAPLAERLVRDVRTLSILATSREALRAAGESVYLLPPLAFPDEGPISAELAMGSPAVQLFMERAVAGGHHGHLCDMEAPLVAEICRRLDGVALAIELAASRVGFYGIRGTMELLNGAGKLRLRGKRTSSLRHQTLEGLLDWSINLLSPQEQAIMFKLAIFSTHFTMEAVEILASSPGATPTDIRAALASLVDKSLVLNASDATTVKYRILDVTRAYALERLTQLGLVDEMARRLANYLNDSLARLQSPEVDDCLVESCAFQIGNVQGVLPWCFSAEGDKKLGVELAAHSARIFMARAQFADCQRWCREALSALCAEHKGTHFHLGLLEALARSCIYARNDGREVRVMIQEALDLARILRDSRCELNLLADLNVLLTRRGEFNEALNAAEQSFAVAKKGGRAEMVLAEWMLAASYHLAGNQAAALQHSEIGQALANTAPPLRLDLFHEARARFAFARSLWLCGYPDQALSAARLAIDESAKHRDSVAYCVSLIYATPVFIWYGHYEDAAQLAETAIAQATKQGLSAFRSLGLALKGELLLSSGHAPMGVEILNEAIDGMHAEKYEIVASYASASLSNGLVLSRRWEDADAVIDAAIYAAKRRSEKLWLPDLFRSKAEILLSKPKPDHEVAEDFLLRSISQAKKQSALSWELRAALPLARMWNANGKRSQASELLGPIYSQFTEGFESIDLRAARELLDEIETGVAMVSA